MLRNIFGLISITAIITAFGIGYARADHLSVTLSVDGGASLTTDRLAVIVTGTYSCAPLNAPGDSDFSSISARVRQASGRVVNQGFGFVSPICDGQLRTFQAPVSEELLMPWHGGLARVNADIDVQDCDEFFTCEFARTSVERQIKISGGAK